MDNNGLNKDIERVLAVLNQEDNAGVELSAAEQQLLQEMQQIKQSGSLYQDLAFRTDEKREQLKAQLGFKEQARKAKLITYRWVGFAAAIATIVFGIWFYTSRYTDTTRHLDDRRDLLNYANDITPGKNTATLSFNGRSMQLSEAKTGVKFDDDKLTYNDGSTLDPSLRGGTTRQSELVTATTPRGGTYQFVLEDGTRVWLNADSKLDFFSSYKNKAQRIVKLEGEGYFEVAKDKTHPFIVESAGQKVEVLGTHFNINAYKDERGIKTTLLEGSVRVSSSRGTEGSLILKPNQQSTLANNTLIIGEADPNATAWVNGKFRFDNTSLEDVMKQIERWYDIEVVYPDGVPDKRFTGGINRNNNISAVLKMLKILKVDFRIEGRKIIINTKN